MKVFGLFFLHKTHYQPIVSLQNPLMKVLRAIFTIFLHLQQILIYTAQSLDPEADLCFQNARTKSCDQKGKKKNSLTLFKIFHVKFE